MFWIKKKKEMKREGIRRWESSRKRKTVENEKRGNQGKGKKSSWGYFCIFTKI